MDYFNKVNCMAKLGMDMDTMDFYKALAYVVDVWVAANDVEDSTVEFVLNSILKFRKEVENEVGKVSREDLDALRAAKVKFKEKKPE